MTRSYKREPVLSNATARSEKEDKKVAHSRVRARFRACISSAKDDEVMFDERNIAHSDVWCRAKDGKRRIGLHLARCGRATQVLKSPAWVTDLRRACKLVGK